MKLRRAMVTAAATAVIAPLAFLSAPAAFATDDPATSANSSTGTSDSSSTGDQSTSSGDQSATSGDQDGSTDDQSATSGDQDGSTDDETATSGDQDGSTDDQNNSSDDQDSSTDDQNNSSDDQNNSSDDEGSPSDEQTAPSDDSDFDPYTDCKSFNLDEKLKASISGLPNKIVAGSGWHNFTFVVENGSDHDLQNVWINAFTEYADAVNDDSSLMFDLAEIQLKQDGKWTDTYQETIGDGDEATTLTGSIVAVLPTLEKNTSATLDLRVKINASAPAGSSFALSQAVYAGKESSCYVNGDYYEFSVLGAGSTKPGNVGDAKPNGRKPTGVSEDLKPQGEVKEATGSLAETGSSSMLPAIGIAGGVAVALGAGALFAVRRRKGAGSNAGA